MRKVISSLFILMILAACGGAGDAYPKQVRENFVKSCAAKASGKTALCDCIFEKISARFTYREFLAIETEMKKGGQATEFLRFVDSATRACVVPVR